MKIIMYKNMVDNNWKEKGFVDEPLPKGMDLKNEIRLMCKEKNAVIMAHYYTEGVVQDVANFVEPRWPGRYRRLPWYCLL